VLTEGPISEAIAEAYGFLVREAELLDTNQMHEWLELVDPDVSYQVPVRITRERTAGLGFSTSGMHMDESFDSLRTRVARLDSDFAWAEDPPSRTRRFVTNLRVTAGENDGEVNVVSNLLLFRARFDTPANHLLSGERRDVLRRTDDGGLRLLKRLVLLDHTTLGTPNLGLIF
jgi:3-phenylpropionate/cinnamic acid dioxygenase small subunit